MSGQRRYCDDCRVARAKVASRRHYEANKVEVRRRATERNRRLPPGERGKYDRKYRPRRLARQHGITVEEAEALLATECCAICGATDRRLVVDHCHETGVVRGRLCSQCNSGLGHFGDDPERLLAAREYLCRRIAPS